MARTYSFLFIPSSIYPFILEKEYYYNLWGYEMMNYSILAVFDVTSKDKNIITKVSALDYIMKVSLFSVQI